MKDQKDNATGCNKASGRRTSLMLFMSTFLGAALVLMPLSTVEFKFNPVAIDDAFLDIPVVEFSFSDVYAADRRGGRSGNRGGRAGGKGADRRGLDRNDSPGTSGNSDSASPASNAGSSGSSSGRGGQGSSSSGNAVGGRGAEVEQAEAGGRESVESEGGDRSPRSWFSIDASDMDTFNVGVISSRMGRDASKLGPDPCMALVCHDVR